MHSSVGGALPSQTGGNMIIGSQGTGQTSAAIYKTNTLDQYGGRNNVLNNINAISSVMGATGAGPGNHQPQIYEYFLKIIFLKFKSEINKVI